MDKKITIQENHKALQTSSNLLILDVQSDARPTKPLLHKQSRFLYILEGEGKIKIEDNVYDLHPRTVISMLPWQVSEIVEVREELTYYLLVFDFNMMNLSFKNELNINNDPTELINALYRNHHAIYDVEVTDKILRILEDIREEVGIYNLTLEHDGSSDKYRSIYLVSKLSELVVIYLRYFDRSYEKEEADFSIDKLSTYMFLNSSKDLSLKILSKVFLRSESYISKYLSRVTGLGFYDFLDEIRMYKANYLLCHTNMTLNEIAAYLNYSDGAALTKKYHDYYNMGTKDYRRVHHAEEKLLGIRFDERYVKILDYVYDHYMEDMDINSVAQAFETNAKMINSACAYYLEMDFYSFLNQVRVRKACDLLVRTHFPIMEIAMMVGYNTMKTFHRHFTKILHVNPQEFRDAHQKEEDEAF